MEDGNRRPPLPEPFLPELADILPFILIGFAAQLVDGALGMAFGVISTTLLVSRGVDPAVASASVHAVEVFTTGASGISHTLHRNVNWKLFRRIVIPGIICGVLGAYVLTQISADTARPVVLHQITDRHPWPGLPRPADASYFVPPARLSDLTGGAPDDGQAARVLAHAQAILAEVG